MYGTIAKLSPLPGKADEILKFTSDWNETIGVTVKGKVAAYTFTPDANTAHLYILAIFEDEATYKANADDPVQDEWYQKMRALLQADPDWMDGTFAE